MFPDFNSVAWYTILKHLTGSFVPVSAEGEAGYFICKFFSIYSLVDLLFFIYNRLWCMLYTKSGFSSFSPVMVLCLILSKKLIYLHFTFMHLANNLFKVIYKRGSQQYSVPVFIRKLRKQAREVEKCMLFIYVWFCS